MKLILPFENSLNYPAARSSVSAQKETDLPAGKKKSACRVHDRTKLSTFHVEHVGSKNLNVPPRLPVTISPLGVGIRVHAILPLLQFGLLDFLCHLCLCYLSFTQNPRHFNCSVLFRFVPPKNLPPFQSIREIRAICGSPKMQNAKFKLLDAHCSMNP